MGRGRKSGHDRKEERKEKRAEAKNTKYEKSPRKVTKGSLKKEFKAKQAVADSFKSASSISMDRKEENMLLKLMAMLDNVCIEPAHVTFHATDKVRTFTEEKDTIKSAADLNTLLDEEEQYSPASSNPESDSGPAESEQNTVETHESQDSGSSDCSDDSDSDSDSESNSSESTSDSESDTSANPALPPTLPETNAQGQVVVGRNKYIRQLIRDERRIIREQQRANLLAPSAERVVARLKQSLQSSSTLNTTTSYAPNTNSTTGTNNISSTGFAYKPAKDRHSTNITPSKPIKPTLSPTVRVNLHYDKSGDGRSRAGAARIMVLNRSLTLSDILDVFRTKCKATALVSSTNNTISSGGGTTSSAKVYKYSAVRIVSSGEILDGFSMLTLPDGEALTLFSSSDVLKYEENGSSSGGSVVSESVVNATYSSAADDNTPDTNIVGEDVITNSAAEETLHSHSATDSATTKNTAADRNTDANTPTPTYWTPPVHNTVFTNTTHTRSADYDASVRTTLTAAYHAPSYTPIHATRTALPIFTHKTELLDVINTHPVVVVSGETGSGKTTQLPLYLMEYMVKNNNASVCNIVCTQPRRIAAISVAERVNYECAQPGPVGTGLVGYQVRLDSKVCDDTLLTYCTTGVLLRKLQNPDYLRTVSHIILDEVHERGVETDFLMTLLKQQYHHHPNLRIILMSATMQENLFPAYFNNCPIVYVSGRTYPITTHYIEEVHEVVAQGQRLLAAQRGKISTSTGGSVTTDTSSMDRDSKQGKKGYKGKHQRLAPDDPSVLKQRPPKFDAELIAELVIRIITTTNHKQGRYSGSSGGSKGGDSSGSGGGGGDNSASVSGTVVAAPTVGIAVASGVNSATNISGAVRGSRISGIQRAAAALRNSTSTTIPTTTTTSTPIPTTPDTNSTTGTTPDTDTDTSISTSTSTSTGDAILVFLSGIQSIEKVSKALRQRGVLQGLKAQVHILHGSQPPEQQKRVFKRTLPGEWKIVLATNIAETSITVSDVTHVIDAGYVKEMRFDPAGGISSLQEVFVSRAAAMQRAGRAGRVRPGDCWRVYSQEFFESTRVDAFPLPEIQRVPLEEVVLQVLLLNLGTPEAFLSQCLQPPSIDQIRQSIAVLIEIRAVLPVVDLPLTALGYHLARMPVDVRIGKMLIYASLLQCVEPVLTIAAALGGKSPFITPIDSLRVEAQLSHSRFLYEHNRESYAYSGSKGGGVGNNSTNSTPSTPSTPTTNITNNTNTDTSHTTTNHYSDLLAILHCYNQFIHINTTSGSDAAYRYCKERYLSFSVLNEMRALREHFRAYLRQTGFLNSGGKGSGSGRGMSSGSSGMEGDVEMELSELQLNEGTASADAPLNYSLIKCALCAGLYPNIVRLGRFKETTNNAKLTPNKHNYKKANVVQKIVQSDLGEVSLHPSCLVSSHTSRILDGIEAKASNSATNGTTSTTNDDTSSGVSDSGSHYSFKSNSKSGDSNNSAKDAFLVYYKKMTINKLFLFDATLVPHAAILLFSNTELVYNHKTQRVTVSGWIEMHITELHYILYRRLQREIEGLLRTKVENPGEDIAVRQRNLVYIVGALVA